MAQSNNVQLVFEAVGSHGDVLPLLALAAKMVQRGYQAHLLANSMFEREAEQHGVAFTPTASRSVNFLPEEAIGFEDYIFCGLSSVKQFFEQLSGRAIVVNLTRGAASNLLCERYNIPTLRYHLSPYVFRSLASPPWPLRAKTEGRLGELFRCNVLPRLYQELDTNRPLLEYINGARGQLGLVPVHSASHTEGHVVGHLAAFPSWFAEPASDWPAGLECVGFPLPKSSNRLPEKLKGLIEASAAPIVFTPGTSVAQTDTFAGLASRCCTLLNRPGVLLSQHHKHASSAHGRSLTQFEYVDLELLLPHAALIVHHGGIGTVARSLQAGVPQLILPTAFDQPDNAHRVRLLGAGAVVEPSDQSGPTVAAAAQELLARAGLYERLRTLSARVSDGLERSANILESLAVRFSTEARSIERQWGGTLVGSSS